MTTSQSITGHDLLTLMPDYNFLRASCMLAPYPKGFFIGRRGGLSRWGSSGRADIFELYLWWLKHKIPPRDLLSLPTAARRSPLWVLGGWPQGRKPLLFHQLSLLARKCTPTSEKAQKYQIEPWKIPQPKNEVPQYYEAAWPVFINRPTREENDPKNRKWGISCSWKKSEQAFQGFTLLPRKCGLSPSCAKLSKPLLGKK